MIVLVSGFCELQALVELKKCGVYVHALIKIRRYWPKYVPGKAIKEHFRDKEVGSVDAFKGQLDGVPFHLYAMKEPDNTMMIMSMYGTLNKFGEEKSGTTLWIESRR